MPTPDLLDALQDPYSPLTEPQIRAVEREIGVRFPDDYVRFLLKSNGGDCQHAMEYVSETHLPGWYSGGVELGKFFAITDNPNDYNDIRLHSPFNKLVEVPVPRHLFVFADTTISPDRFCIVGAGPEFGKVYFWANDDFSINYIAPSFTAFLECVKLGEDTNLELPHGHEDKVPVFEAIRRGDIAAVKKDLGAGRDINFRNAYGHTMLMCAAHYSWPKIVELLLSRGADVHARDSAGEDAIFRAVFAQSLDCINLLLAAGADPNSCSNSGESLVGQSHILLGSRVYKALLAGGAKPDSTKESEAE